MGSKSAELAKTAVELLRNYQTGFGNMGWVSPSDLK